MITINEHFNKLKASYLFSDIAKKVTAFKEQNPQTDVIRLGIGDVTLPLAPACREAFKKAVDELGDSATFRGYGPEQGYAFLRQAICEAEYTARNCGISADEIFISDGAKCDTGNFQELFSTNISVAVPDPVYPVYVDTNVMAGRTGAFGAKGYQSLYYLQSTRENGYLPEIPKEKLDLIYLCFPNNPTGTVADKAYLKNWVDYALANDALILFDAAYSAFIRNDELPQSIYEIEGAHSCAVEFKSFSKSAGFTGTRCAYTVVPKQCRAFTADGKQTTLHTLWNRRHCTKFNGVSYPVQRAAEAVYSEQGKIQTREQTDYYLTNAALILKSMQELGFNCTGGQHSPYIWVDTGKDSWKMFDEILTKTGVVITPGAGFGACGEGHIRISAFNDLEKVQTAMERLSTSLKS